MKLILMLLFELNKLLLMVPIAINFLSKFHLLSANAESKKNFHFINYYSFHSDILKQMYNQSF